MTFSTNVFLIGLLPWFVLLCFLFREIKKARSVLIILANSLFYLWGGVGIFIFVCCFSIFIWIFSMLVFRLKNKLILSIVIVITILPLIFVKYVKFAILNIRYLFNIDIKYYEIAIPIGLSFFTFEAVSLLCDLYKGKVQGNISIFQVYCYLTFFPTVTSGPIIRFATFQEGLYSSIDIEKYNEAIVRIILGLCKKVLVSDKISILSNYYFDGTASGISYSSVGLWIGSIAYTVQLYFDFSGYSDIAIGIGQLLGFNIDENFNKPYLATSISDFWKRWHISLSRWFRDYVYIPLGGNRCSISRQIFNMFIVWMLTGIWHGADWSFIAWGLGYFLLLAIEKYIPVINKISGTWVGHIYSLFFINLLWIPFRASDLRTTLKYICGMAGIGSRGIVEDIAIKYIPFLGGAMLLCFPLEKLFVCIKRKKWFDYAKGTIIIVLLILTVCAVVNASYSPYIYGSF